MASSLVCDFESQLEAKKLLMVKVVFTFKKNKEFIKVTDGFLFPLRFYKPVLSYPHSLWKCVSCLEVFKLCS